MKVELVIYDEVFLELSWKWLNDPEIKLLTNTTNFTKNQQILWFKEISKRNDYKIWGILADSEPVGVCGLKNITDLNCEYWGYIGEKEYWGKGIGGQVLNSLENIARKMNIKSIWLKVLNNNERAIALYTRSGYIFESRDDHLAYMSKEL